MEIEEDPECTALRNVTFDVAKVKPDPSTRPEGAAFQFVQFYLEIVLLGVFLLTFAFFKHLHPDRRHFHRLHIRKTYFLLITHFGAAMSCVTGSWNDIHSLPYTIPCFILFAFVTLIPPCMILPQVVQLRTFYRDELLTQTVVKQQSKRGSELLNPGAGDAADAMSQTAESFVDEESTRVTWRQLMRFICKWRSVSISDAPAPATTAASSIQVAGDAQVVPNTPRHSSFHQPGWVSDVKALNILRSEKTEALLVAIYFLPFLVTVAIMLGTMPMVRLGCWGCMGTRSSNMVTIIEGLIIIIILVVSYRANLKKSDPFGIINEIRMVVWLGGAPAVFCLILSVILDKRSNFKPDMLIEIFLVIVCFIQSVLQCILATLDLRKERAAATRFDMTLQEFDRQVIQPNGPYHDAFARHLASEHGYESLAFIQAVLIWEHQYFDAGPKTSKVRARKLMNIYVGDKAALPCNLPESLVKKMEAQMSVDGEPPSMDLFRLAKEEMVQLLYQDSFRRFLRTKEFKKIRDEAGQQDAV